PGGVGGGVAQGAELVGVHVPDTFLVRVPALVQVLAGPRRPVKLIGDVVVHVVDDQVRVAAVVHPDRGAILLVAFDHVVGRQGEVLQVALAGVGIDDNRSLRRAVPVDDI